MLRVSMTLTAFEGSRPSILKTIWEARHGLEGPCIPGLLRVPCCYACLEDRRSTSLSCLFNAQHAIASNHTA